MSLYNTGSLLQQLKKRRLALGFKQNDMTLRVGISRQQYQRLESKGNPRLATLELVAKGLNSELMLIPQDKLGAVLAVLENPDTESKELSHLPESIREPDATYENVPVNPWQDLLEDD